MTPVLVSIGAAGLGRRHPLSAETLIGRHGDCDIQLVDSEVSKHHARIRLEGSGATIEDLDSRNGVLVNGQRLAAPARLVSNDVIVVGGNAFLFDPRLDVLPVADGRAAVVVTEEEVTQSGRVIRRPLDPAPAGSALADRLLALVAEAPADADVPAKLLAEIGRCVGFDGAALLAAGGDGLETVAVAGGATLSAPRSIVRAALDGHEALLIPDALGDTSFAQGKSVIQQRVRSVVAVPLAAGGTVRGLLYLTRNTASAFTEAELGLLVGSASVLAAALAAHRACDELSGAVSRATARAPRPPSGSPILGQSPATARVRELVQRAAPVSSPVLVTGPTGSGKELVALELHRLGRNPQGPFVPINCGAVPENLIESEFFGHERGAFSGADRAKPGTLELASGGTLFLDEVGELPAALQAKLLRALETKSFYRLGGVKAVKVDFRLVAATHRDLAAMVAAGSFRQDLFFRLNVIAIETPALAQRVDDIPDLAWFFVARLAAELGRKPPALAPSALAALGRHPWPGNIRELRNVLERALVLCEADPLEAGHLTLGAAGPREDGDGGTLAEQVAALERRRIEQALRAARGRKVDAARALGISRPTLDKKVKDYAIDIFAEGE